MTRLLALAAATLLAACAASNTGKPGAQAANAPDPRCAYLAEIAARMDGQVPPPPAPSVPGSAPVTGTAAARACSR